MYKNYVFYLSYFLFFEVIYHFYSLRWSISEVILLKFTRDFLKLTFKWQLLMSLNLVYRQCKPYEDSWKKDLLNGHDFLYALRWESHKTCFKALKINSTLAFDTHKNSPLPSLEIPSAINEYASKPISTYICLRDPFAQLCLSQS